MNNSNSITILKDNTEIEESEVTEISEINKGRLLEFYNAIPKYYEGDLPRDESLFLDPLAREFEFQGKKFLAEIPTFRLEDTDGIIKDFYPAVREKLLEQVLRKLVRDNNYISPDKSYDGVFDLKVIKDELKLLGKEYSDAELKIALIICASTTITVSTENREYTFILRAFDRLGFMTKTKGDATEQPGDEEEESLVYVKFAQGLK